MSLRVIRTNTEEVLGLRWGPEARRQRRTIHRKCGLLAMKRVVELSLIDFLPALFEELVLALLRTEVDPAAEGNELVPDHSERS
jgi:hypothetical protein